MNLNVFNSANIPQSVISVLKKIKLGIEIALIMIIFC
jgi:hypothetical protein